MKSDPLNRSPSLDQQHEFRTPPGGGEYDEQVTLDNDKQASRYRPPGPYLKGGRQECLPYLLSGARETLFFGYDKGRSKSKNVAGKRVFRRPESAN